MFDPQHLGSAAIGLGIMAASVYNGWQTVQAKREARNASQQATRAAENAHPVSNGWGSQVSADLAYLRTSMDRAHSRLDVMDRRQQAADDRLALHLADHARRDPLTERPAV